MIVPKNKKVYIGARRFIEGDILPPYLGFNLENKKEEKKAKEETPKRKYTRKNIVEDIF